jgi:hypothetical protein
LDLFLKSLHNIKNWTQKQIIRYLHIYIYIYIFIYTYIDIIKNIKKIFNLYLITSKQYWKYLYISFLKNFKELVQFFY